MPDMQRIKRQLPTLSALASCADSAGGATTSVDQLSDTSSALDELSDLLKASFSAANCAGAIKDLDNTKDPGQAKVRPWGDFTGKLTGTSSEVAKYAAPFHEIYRFCTAINLPRFRCV
jgi:hypothetical protein